MEDALLLIGYLSACSVALIAGIVIGYRTAADRAASQIKDLRRQFGDF